MGFFTERRLSVRVGCILLALAALLSPTHAYTELPDDALRGIPSGGDGFDIKSGSLLAPILIPRVPGTPGSFKAQEHFVSFFKTKLPEWRIEWHNSTAKTPATGDKDIPFTNLIFVRDPPWAKVGDVGRLTLVAHYDTLAKKWKAMQDSGDAGMGLEEEVGVQILLLDGEEAWVRWTAEDSLYGSRALAESWETEVHPAMSTYKSPINSISLFLLLDLLGAKNPRIPSYFPTTHWAYQTMAKIEGRMRKLGIIESTDSQPFLPELHKEHNQFRRGFVEDDHVPQFRRGFVEDDHVPFMARGVEILHMIPTPFPPQWHKMEDDGEHLDIPTVRDWTRIVTAFTAEWLDIAEYLPKKTEKQLKRETTETAKTEL
ncbi:Glutaminyl-peptide cyclotransferase like protein [Verticillium longisporum]|nr:Glutaminyl-peptide cyclotransferase like protein [Verticillium longisporum]